MKLLFVLVLLSPILFLACGAPDDDMQNLQSQNAALRAKNDSLERVIERLERAPDEVVRNAKQLIAAGKRDSAAGLLKELQRRSLRKPAESEVARLLKEPKRTNARSKKQAVAAATPDATDEDASLYTGDNNSKELNHEDKVEHNWQLETTPERVKRPVQEKTYGVRVGAICRDGTRSSATGRGACSHHGGVSEWIVQ